MPLTVTTRILRSLVATPAVAAAVLVAGCGGGGAQEPSKAVKPGQNVAPDALKQLDEMKAHFTPIKRDEDAEKEAPVAGRGKTQKGGKKAATPAAPKGLIIRK